MHSFHIISFAVLATKVVVLSRSVVWDSATPCAAAHWASLSFTAFWMSTSSRRPNSCPCQWCCQLTLCRPLLLLPSVFPSQHQCFLVTQLFASGGQSIGASASVSPSSEYSGLISFRIDRSSCSPRDSQESSATPQFKSINS